MAYDRIRELREDHDLRQVDVAKILVMAAYGMSVRDTTESSCVAELMRLYQEFSEETVHK